MLSIPEKICISILAILLILCIIVGNLLVILSIVFDKVLRSQLQTWFLLSLALSDFLVGVLIMPFSLITELTPEWIFGPIWCELYRALDVLFVTASIWNLCLISLDRLWAVTRPIDYITRRTPRIICTMIVSVWILAILISIPPLMIDIGEAAIVETVTPIVESVAEASIDRHFDLSSTSDKRIGIFGSRNVMTLTPDGVAASDTSRRDMGYLYQQKSSFLSSNSAAGKHPNGSYTVQPRRALIHCTIPNHPLYVIYSACGSFYLPVVVVLGVYIRIYIITRKRAHEQQIALKRISTQIDLGVQRYRVNALTDQDFLLLVMINPENIPLLFRQASTKTRAGSNCSQAAEQQKLALRERHKKLRQHEKRNNIMLGTVLLAFIGCWLPFFTVYLLSGFGLNAYEVVFKVFFWLGYCNSAINPALYTLFNMDFRRVFRKLCFTSHKNSINSSC